jgi:hypothetical protein
VEMTYPVPFSTLGWKAKPQTYPHQRVEKRPDDC